MTLSEEGGEQGLEGHATGVGGVGVPAKGVYPLYQDPVTALDVVTTEVGPSVAPAWRRRSALFGTVPRTDRVGSGTPVGPG